MNLMGNSSTRPEDSGLALLTVNEAARLLAVSGEAVRVKARSGEPRAYRLGNGPKARIRVPASEIARHLGIRSAEPF